MNILFLCTGNSCRSIIAEALFTSRAPAGVTVQSAGSKPAGVVHPRALAVLKEAGLSIEGLSSKSLEALSIKPDVVITLCADAAARLGSAQIPMALGGAVSQPGKGAAGAACPLYFGKVVRSHWGMPDPAKAQGDEAAINAAFTETLVVRRRRVSALVKQLEAEPGMDAARLQTVLDDIAAM